MINELSRAFRLRAYKVPFVIYEQKIVRINSRFDKASNKYAEKLVVEFKDIKTNIPTYRKFKSRSGTEKKGRN